MEPLYPTNIVPMHASCILPVSDSFHLSTCLMRTSPCHTSWLQLTLVTPLPCAYAVCPQPLLTVLLHMLRHAPYFATASCGCPNAASHSCLRPCYVHPHHSSCQDFPSMRLTFANVLACHATWPTKTHSSPRGLNSALQMQLFEIGLTGTVSMLSGEEAYCMVVALGGYGWYLVDLDGVWNSGGCCIVTI